MKTRNFYTLVLGVMTSCSVSAQMMPISGLPFQGTINAPMTTTPSAQTVNVEAPFRCSVKEVGDVDVMTTLSLRPGDFKLTQADAMEKLPRFEVNGFSFATIPVDEAIQKLVDEAGISVYTEDGVYPELNANDIYGELGPVVQELTAAGDVFYRYDATRKRLYLSRKAEFKLQLPPSRTVMLAMMDAIRGAGIASVSPDWKKSAIMLTLNREEEGKINELTDYILKDSKILLADTQVYSVMGQGNWQQVIEKFGAGRVYTSDNGIIGKMITMGHKKKTEDLLAAMGGGFTPTLLSEGIAIVPHGWKMRFDVGRCALKMKDVNSLSVLLNTKIKSPDEVNTTISLDTVSGEVTSFNVTTAVDNELAILGIPGAVAGQNMPGELLITLKLRFIRLIPEGAK